MMKIQKNESVTMSFEGRKEILLLNRILTALLEDKVGFKNSLLNEQEKDFIKNMKKDIDGK